MTTQLDIKESQLSPSFNEAQRGILRKLATLIINAIDTTIASLSLDDLDDVNAPSPVDRDRLTWDSSTSRWVAEDTFTPVVTVSDTSYTSLLTNADKFLKFTAATAVTFTIAPQSSVAWLSNTQIEFEQHGAGQVTVAGGSGVTVRVASPFDPATRAQYSVCGLKRVAEDEWVLFGDLEVT